MSDRPEYGEFASPEDQRRHIRQPLPDLDQPPPGFGPNDRQVRPAPASVTGDARPSDRILTIVLLALGGLNVLMTAPGMFALAASLQQAFVVLGVPGEFTNVAGAQQQGALAGVILIAGIALTAYLSIRRIRAGRRSWWIPVLGAVVSYALMYAVLTPVLLNDPAFMTYVSTVPAP